MDWLMEKRDSRVLEYNSLFSRVAVIDDPEVLLTTVISGMAQIQGPRGYIRLATHGLPQGHYRITRFTDDDGAVLIGAETWGDNIEGFPEHEGGFLGEIVDTPDPKLIHNLFLKDDPILADQLAVYGAAMAIPIHTRLDPGDWLVILSRDVHSFSRDDLPEAIMRGNLIGGVLESLTITQKLEKAQALIQHEVNEIADIERQLLFDSEQNVPGMDFAASYLTFDRAGGDYFRFIELPRENGTDTPAPWAIIIADAAGHGASAAVIVALMHALLARIPTPVGGPSALLEYLNHHLKSWQTRHCMVTAFCGIFDPATRTMRYSRAGHEIPFVKAGQPGSPNCRLDGAQGFPLGVVADAEYDEGEITFESGDCLLLYTDGVTDASSPEHVLYGVDRLEAGFLEAPSDPKKAIEFLQNRIAAYELGERSADDQTMVVCSIE
jgi:sigma-B regulation protein RsbU (phosphoserine phosphatase)